MKWEYIGTGLAILAIGITIMLAVPPPWWPKMPHPLIQAAIALGLVLVIIGFGITGLGTWPGLPEPRGPIALSVAGGVFLILGLMWLTFTPKFGARTLSQYSGDAPQSVLISREQITLHDLFESDLSGRSYNMVQGFEQGLFINNKLENLSFEIGLYGDFQSRSLFMGLYIPATEHYQALLSWLSTSGYKNYLYDAKTNLHMWPADPAGDSQPISDDLQFTKQVYIYYENIIPDAIRFQLESDFRIAGLQPTFRGFNYLQYRREHGPRVAKRKPAAVAQAMDQIPPIFTPDPSNDIDPTLLTLFMTDMKGDGRGLKSVSYSDVSMEILEKRTRLTTRVLYNLYYDRTSAKSWMAIYVPLFQLPQQVIEFCASQISAWKGSAKKNLLAKFPDATWLDDSNFLNKVYIYSQISIDAATTKKISAAFDKYGLKAEIRGNEYWLKKLSEIRDNKILMPTKYVMVNGIPEAKDGTVKN